MKTQREWDSWGAERGVRFAAGWDHGGHFTTDEVQPMTDHEQIRRDIAYAYVHESQGAVFWARRCETVLAELEQAERERDEARTMARAEQQRGDVMEHERDWEQEVVNADLWNRLQAAEAQLAAVPALVEALRLALDCKGPYNGKRSDRGGYPAVCCECVDQAERALAAWEQAQNG